jgi:hypothetical protein
MTRSQTPDPRDIEKAVKAALLLDVQLTDAAFYTKAGKNKTRLQNMIDMSRQIRRDIEELQNELVEKAS